MSNDQPSWLTTGGVSRRVALEVLLHGPVSRIDLSRTLQLSPATLTRQVQPLIEQGVLVETGEHIAGQTGRPARLLDVATGNQYFVGIKLTDRRVSAVLTDLRAEIIASCVRELPSHTADDAAETISQCVRDLVHETGSTPVRIGIGLGGTSPDNRMVSSAPFLGWTGVDLASAVEAHTNTPTLVENDVTAFMEYQNWFGEGAGTSQFAAITIGAGVGYGLVMDRRVIVTRDSSVGLVGHWPLDPLGPLCPSGHRGCAMSILTRYALEQRASEVLGRPATLEEFLEQCSEHTGLRSVAAYTARMLGHLVAAVANLTMAEVIVLGGEGIDVISHATDELKAGVLEHRDPRAGEVRLALTDGDDTVWCRGAAAIAIQAHVLGGNEI